MCCRSQSLYKGVPRSHTAGVTLAELDKIAPDHIKNHPPQSPDLNIIEDIWAHMGREIRKEKNIADIDDLQKRLRKVWAISRWTQFGLPSRACRGDWPSV